MSIISLKSVCKSFPSGETRIHVLRALDLEIRETDFAVVAAPSGSGKSTLLNLIGGLDRADSGAVRIDKVDLAGLKDRALANLRNEKIGFIFQSFHLIPVLTAAENVAWPLFLKGVGGRQRMARAKALLERVGLAGLMNRTPGRLSGGQRQRVAIARALACKPKIILADEPTANLDQETALDVIKLLARLNRDSGVTFVFSTHDQMIEAYATRRLRLVDGHVVETPAATEFAEGGAHA
ncbi:ABC transporter ATP-binding protein [Candidatus Spongiihabitans sp.]|uniref:ABC transporter ATP-binding protein n=1 Tax=Candidatus Spongiihabitans sp. TaxID=3101308 RepID=UPI003C70424C